MSKTARVEAIDQYRGFAILLMVAANFLFGVENLPAWMKHASGIGYTVVDLIAPLFLFAIALTYRPSWQRRCRKEGARRTAEHFVGRYAAIAGIGFLATVIDKIVEGGGWTEPWGVLQAIGGAGLMALLVIGLGWRWRLFAGLAVLGTYQILLESGWRESVAAASHGGLKGTLGWGALLILGTVLVDTYHRRMRAQAGFVAASAALLVAGGVLALRFPVAKEWVSASYVLVSLGACGLVFAAFDLLCERLGFRSRVLDAWGQNPLLLYILHLVLLGAFVLPGGPHWYVHAAGWVTAVELAGLLAVLSAIGLYLRRKGWTFSL